MKELLIIGGSDAGISAALRAREVDPGSSRPEPFPPQQPMGPGANDQHGMGEDAPGRDSMKTVLFACIHNAGRSQMAAAWFNALADRNKAAAISAGTEPGTRVHPEVLNAMREVGIELDGVAPQKLTD